MSKSQRKRAVAGISRTMSRKGEATTATNQVQPMESNGSAEERSGLMSCGTCSSDEDEFDSRYDPMFRHGGYGYAYGPQPGSSQAVWGQGPPMQAPYGVYGPAMGPAMATGYPRMYP